MAKSAIGFLLILLPLQDRWEADIRKFEEQDRVAPPPSGGAVFVGSSSIRLWNLREAFPDLPVLNRGFGGSQMADAARYAERIVIPYKPRVVTVFAGGNDIHAGKTPEEVCAAFKELVGKIHAALPETRVYFISLFPNLARAAEDPQCRRVNELIRAFTRTDPRLGYIDARPRMENAEGKARPELLREDGLHLNAEGYKVWNEIVGPVIRAALGK
jgi:lysophospholipase L1-like esterase